MYCGIIIVHRGPMFVAFVGISCPQTYIPMNLYTIICLILIKVIPITLPTKLCPHKLGKLWLPTNFDPHE